MARIIVVEDERLVRDLYVGTLRDAGHQVQGASDANACRAILREGPVDLLMLDLGLPGQDGLSLAAELRDNREIGLMVVSRRQDPEDRIQALELGCDDYLVKPVHLGELCARVSAVLRRRTPRRRLRFGAIEMDLDARTVRAAGQLVQLTRGEFTVLALLADAGGRIVGRERLCGTISRGAADGDLRTVDSLVRRIRRKMAEVVADDVILTAPGFGYRLGLVVEDG